MIQAIFIGGSYVLQFELRNPDFNYGKHKLTTLSFRQLVEGAFAAAQAA
jgi:hypothetical protein